MLRLNGKNKARHFKRHVLACLFCLLLIAFAAVPVCAISYTTESFHTTLDVQANSSMHVTETITVNFESPAHGIYRDIWTLDKCWFVNSGGELVETDMMYRLKHFKCEGEEIKKTTSTNYVTIRIGSADVTVTGPHTYKLEYDVVMYKDSLSDIDQLYWNIMPMYWQTDVGEFSYTINMPKAFDESQVEIISGPIGTGDTSRGIYTVNGTTVEGTIDGPVASGEGVTVRIKLPQGYWRGAKDDSPKAYILMSLIGLLTCYVATLFFRYGRDRRPVKTVEFYPLDGMSSAELGYLYDAKLQKRDMISLVMWFASMGYLKIKAEDKQERGLIRNGKKNITLHKLADLPEDAPAYQKTFFNGLFPKSKTVADLNKLTKSFGSKYVKAERELQEDYSSLMIDPKSEESRGKGCLVAIVIFLLTVLSFCIFKLTDSLYESILGEAFLCLVFIFIFIRFMLRPSDYRVEMMGKIKGFREFIKKAELDRINKLVEQDPDYFYRILPYAYVFGLTDKWAKHFETLAQQPPEWYDGPVEFFVNPSQFCSSFERTASRSIAAAMPKPTGSSVSGGGGGGGFSSGGGGFSGGGGGGGGGGAW